MVLSVAKGKSQDSAEGERWDVMPVLDPENEQGRFWPARIGLEYLLRGARPRAGGRGGGGEVRAREGQRSRSVCAGARGPL